MLPGSTGGSATGDDAGTTGGAGAMGADEGTTTGEASGLLRGGAGDGAAGVGGAWPWLCGVRPSVGTGGGGDMVAVGSI